MSEEYIPNQPKIYTRSLLGVSKNIRSISPLDVEVEESTCGSLDPDFRFHVVGPNMGTDVMFFANGPTEKDAVATLKEQYARIYAQFEKRRDGRLNLMQQFLRRTKGDRS